MTERKVLYVSLRSTLGVTGLNWRGTIERITMAEDARETVKVISEGRVQWALCNLVCKCIPSFG